MSNLSRCRSEGRRAARSIRYSSNFGAQRAYTKVPKKPKTLLEYALTDMDMIFVMDTRHIIPQWVNFENTVCNPVFRDKNIRCDMVGLIYSHKKKMYYYLALNDNYTCYILFKDKDVSRLPNSLTAIDMNHINPDFKILDNGNRLVNSVYDEIADLTGNPIHVYKVGELFRK